MRASNDVSELLNVLREQELLPVNVLAVMLVGSRARGWDNDKSDFDIYVVTDRIWTSDSSASRSIPLNPPVIGSETFYTSDERWEVTYWQDAQVGQILSKVSWAEFGREQAAGQVLSVGEEIFLDRLPHCRVLVGPAWVEARRTELATSAFRSFVVARSLSAADDSVIAGNFDITQLPMGDGEGAAHAACLGGWQMFVSRYSENQDAAKAFAKYMCSPELQKSRAIELAKIPTIGALYSDEDVLAANPFFAQLFDVFESGSVARPSTPSADLYGEVTLEYYTAVSEILSGSAEAGPRVEDLASSLEDIMADV